MLYHVSNNILACLAFLCLLQTGLAQLLEWSPCAVSQELDLARKTSTQAQLDSQPPGRLYHSGD